MQDLTLFAAWINEAGIVQEVKMDNDFGIYQTLPAGVVGPPAKVGETHFVDAFVSPDSHKPVGRIYAGQDITGYIKGLANDAAKLSTDQKDYASQSGKSLDVKNVYPGHEGKSYHGFLLNGKYVSLREAGNILAGINARSHSQSFSDYMKGAGAYQQKGAAGALANKLFGTTFGSAPYWGEQDYTGSRVKFGYDMGIEGLK